jgi:hypothetical protein
MKLAAIELPTTFYNISPKYKNHYFFISVLEDGNTVSQTTLFEMPAGNYEADGFLAAANIILSNLDAPFSSLQFQLNLTESGTGDGRLSIVVNPNPAINPPPTIIEFALDFKSTIGSGGFGIDLNDATLTKDLPLKLGWLMGFRKSTYTTETNISTEIVGEGILDLSGIRYTYLVVDDFNTSVDDGFFGSVGNSLLSGNILARISIFGYSFSLQNTNSQNGIVHHVRNYHGPVDIGKLHFKLIDEYGREVDLNYMDFSVCLTLETGYDL